jgi:hypothetical protein
MRWTDDTRNDRQPESSGGLGPLGFGGLMLALCLALASLAPAPLLALSLSSLTSMAAWVAAATALLRGETIEWTRWNRWDVALAFFALSIAAGWFVDLQAVEAFVAANAAGH